MSIYIASKTGHAHLWKKIRDKGYPIISTWIDEAGVGESKNLADLWIRCIRESSEADVTIVYREEGEILKGAFIEIGSALSSGKPVLLTGYWKDNLSFLNHPLVTVVPTVMDALAFLESRT